MEQTEAWSRNIPFGLYSGYNSSGAVQKSSSNWFGHIPCCSIGFICFSLLQILIAVFWIYLNVEVNKLPGGQHHNEISGCIGGGAFVN
jgi:hypothetical protein